MDGLECSEIRMSDVCDTTTLRFDSDYYKKEYLEIEQFICKNRDKFVTIESQGLQVDASAFYPSLEPYYNTGTIPFVRVADVKSVLQQKHLPLLSCARTNRIAQKLIKIMHQLVYR